jgi:hypothetical protein
LDRDDRAERIKNGIEHNEISQNDKDNLSPQEEES